MRITFYTFSKKSNSTARPDITGTDFDCQIKSPSSIVNPVIQLSKASDPTTFNYAYIPEWKRYYFINDITYNLGLWVLSLTVDVLGTYRNQILLSEQYVLRNANDFDDNIVDNLYPVKAGSSYVVNNAGAVIDPDYQISLPDYFNASYTSGYFIIGVISNNSSGVTYYELSYSGFTSLLNSLMSYIPTDFDDVSDGIAKAMLDPLQYITSCFWYPVSMTRGITPVTSSINIGGYNIPVSSIGGVIQNRSCHFRSSVTIPKHPQYDDYGYTQLEPYSRYNLFFEPFGNIPLDTMKMYEGTSLTLDWYVDVPTGEAQLFVRNGSILVANVSSLIAVQVRLSQLVNDIIGGTTSLSGGLMGAVAGLALGDYIGAITSGLSGISSAVNSMLPQLSTRGSEGSFLAYSLGSPKLHALFNLQVDTDPQRYGRPLCKIRTLKNLSGYTLCSNASLSLSCTDNELTEIENYLNGGFYIE